MTNFGSVFSWGSVYATTTLHAQGDIDTQDGEILEQGERVYSPNNPPPTAGFGMYDRWNYTVNTSTPSWGQCSTNASVPASATTLYFNVNSGTGQDFSGLFKLLPSGSRIAAQSSTADDSWIMYTTTSAFTVSSGVGSVGVVVDSVGSAATTGWATISVLFTQAPITSASMPTGTAAGQYPRYNGASWVASALTATDLSGTVPIGNLPTGTTSTTVSLGNHTHLTTDITSGIMDIARLPVATSGTSSSTQVVRANDSRLSDARTPTTHSHTTTDVTSGTFDIARIPTGTTSTTVSLGNHTHAAADVTSGTFATGRIPDLSADKITSGILGTARVPVYGMRVSSGTLVANTVSNISITFSDYGISLTSTPTISVSLTGIAPNVGYVSHGSVSSTGFQFNVLRTTGTAAITMHAIIIGS